MAFKFPNVYIHDIYIYTNVYIYIHTNVYIYILYILMCIYIYIYIYLYIYTHTLEHRKLNGTKELFGKSNRSCKREFDLRYINNETTFGEKNPTENDKFSSEICFCYNFRKRVSRITFR